MKSKEEFSREDICRALKQWLDFGEEMFSQGQQLGYFSGDGWAARCLRHHWTALESEKRKK